MSFYEKTRDKLMALCCDADELDLDTLRSRTKKVCIKAAAAIELAQESDADWIAMLEEMKQHWTDTFSSMDERLNANAPSVS